MSVPRLILTGLRSEENPLAEQLKSGAAEHLHTVTDPGTLRAQLQRARTDGCAHSVEELEKGLNAAAAPVFTFNGEVMAATPRGRPSG